MTWTPTTVTLLDGSQVAKTFIAYTDGTSFSFAHPLLDNTGAIFNPATAANQSTEISSLAAIASSVAAATPAGTNLIGKVGFDQTTPGTTNRVVESIQPTTFSGSFTRPATTPTYASGQLVANSGTAGSVVPVTLAIAKANDVPGIITGLRLKNSSATTALGIFRVHVIGPAYGGVANGDAGTFTPTNIANLLGYFDVTMVDAGSDGSMGYGIPMNGAPFVDFTPLTGTQNVDFLIEARAAYLGISAQTFTIYVDVA